MPSIPCVSGPTTTEGDENKYLWSTRIPEETHQSLIDLMSEYHINKAQLLREMIFFGIEYIPKVLKEQGENPSKRMQANARAQAAVYEFMQRQTAVGNIIDLLTKANETDYPPLKAKLNLAAKQIAEVWNLEFPPSSLPLITRDKDAAYVLGRIHAIMNDRGTNTIRLNELNSRAHKFNANELRNILERLKESEYIELVPEITSGPETLWITAPTFPDALVPNP